MIDNFNAFPAIYGSYIPKSFPGSLPPDPPKISHKEQKMSWTLKSPEKLWWYSRIQIFFYEL